MINEANSSLIDDGWNPVDMSKLSYDNSIVVATRIIRKYKNEVMGGWEHFIVDEIQDLTDVRAKFVLELIKGCLEIGCGFTVLGDSCQSIYDYDVENIIDPMWDIAKGASMISMSSGHYGLSTPLGLMLSSGEFFELISKGQPLPCRQRTINLATVDNSKQAKFVITDAKDPHRRSFTQNVTVKSLGFLEEQFELSCFIDEDNLFRLRIRSTQFQEIVLHTWTYDRIKVFYELEGNKDGV